MVKRRESKAKDLDVLECVLVTGGFSAFITFCCCYSSSSSFSGGAGGEDDVCLLLVQEQKRVKRRERSLFLPQQQI